MKNINKVIVKEKDEWSSFAEFIGNLVAKYADEMDFDSLPDPDVYLFTRDTFELYKKYVDEMQKYLYSHIEIEFVI